MNKKNNFFENHNHLSFELDSEFYSDPVSPDKSKTLTTQIKCHQLKNDHGVVYTHDKSLLDCPSRLYNNPMIEHLNHQSDLVEPFQYEFSQHSIKRFKKVLEDPSKLEKIPTLNVEIWGFFLIADLLKTFTGKEGEFLKKGIKGEYEGINIELRRHLKFTYTYTIQNNKTTYTFVDDFIPTPWQVNGKMILLAVRDTAAAFGAKTTYQEAGLITNTPLPDKGTMDDHKADMEKAMLEKPEEFKRYALGDLHSKKMYDSWQNIINKICNSLGIDDVKAEFTLGKTIHNIFWNYVSSKLGLNSSDMDKYNFNLPTTNVLMNHKKNTSQFLAKVNGGRIHNNRPLNPRQEGRIVDIDISSCYVSTMKSLIFPLGRPYVLDYPKSSNTSKENKNNEYKTLRQFLKEFKKELYPKAWIARVSTPEGYELKFPQDLIESWYPPKKIDDLNSDTKKTGYDILNPDNDGETCILKREIHLGIITSNELDWIENCCGKQQKAELLDNLYVKAALIHPATHKRDTLKEVMEDQENFDGNNTFKCKTVNNKLTEARYHQHCYSWCEAPLSEFIEKISDERKKYDKHNPQQYPLNKAYKDIGNTLSGDIISRYFNLSNVIVGNMITSRARLMAWVLEKGLNTFQTITDGGQFNLDQIITHGKQRVTPASLVEQKGIAEKTLTYTTLEGETKKEIEKNAMKHLKFLFPNLEILKENIYTLEIKPSDSNSQNWLATGISTRGSGDYLLMYKEPKAKMRGWNDKLYTVEGEPVDIINSFLTNIYQNPKAISRFKPYLESYILKTKDYQRWPEDFSERNIKPGDNIVKTRQMQELSLSTFTFQTKKQRDSWQKATDQLKRDFKEEYNLNYGQSFEMFFLNDDGTLNYEQMIEELWNNIEEGRRKPSCITDKNRNSHRYYRSHPYLEERKELKLYQATTHG